MKVLFAVNNEEISESIVKKYQKQYKEIISYKNVYYFNAILKELQKDKNYDRVVISEELEAFTNTQYSQIDKFIFDKLDSISDEASNVKGEDIPIILICSDRREKSEEMLVKLFGIGVYDALIGNDRSIDNVCSLLNKPRLKKEAKAYYKIESEDVTYQSESENDVSEIEIQNILAHYKRLGRDEKKYVESFDNIASQYNDVQLRIISKFLPLNVRAVLEEQSHKYQQVISFNSKVSDNLRAQLTNKEIENGTSERLLNTKNANKVLDKPVVIPSSVNTNSNIKLAKKKTEVKPADIIEDEIDDNEIINAVEPMEEDIVETFPQEPKRGRGRPRKYPVSEAELSLPKRGRGRPRKNSFEEEKYEETILHGFNEEYDENEETVLHGFDNQIEEKTILHDFDSQEEDSDDAILPGFEDQDEEENIDVSLPGFDDEDEYVDNDEDTVLHGFGDESKEEEKDDIQIENKTYEDIDISHLLTADKKVACFVGTSKNGTSFVVNNLAEMASKKGIDTAILDTTKNRNSYYIYTKNEEQLRKTAINTVKNLVQGEAEGIQVNRNLSVYTCLPDETEEIGNVGRILQTLLKKHSLILIDCDFDTPIKYFEKAQEIYLVQTYDILTIQPLTAFLRDLKAKNILKENKLRIILNKVLRLRGINDNKIIGGIAYYNDPSMSFMTELFNKETVRYITIPFNEEVYIKYLECIINCEISINRYPKNITQILSELCNMVYPQTLGKTMYNSQRTQNNAFTASMNSTLDQMKKKY